MGSLRDPDADQSAVTARAGEVRDQRLAPAEGAVAAARSRDDAAIAARRAEGAPLSIARGSDIRSTASRDLDKAVVEDTYLPDRTHKNELYRAIDPGGVEMRDPTPLVAAVQRIREAEAALPPSMQTNSPILTDIEGMIDPQTGQARRTSFRDLETMRMKLSRAANAARSGERPNLDLADAYDAIRRAIGREGQRRQTKVVQPASGPLPRDRTMSRTTHRIRSTRASRFGG